MKHKQPSPQEIFALRGDANFEALALKVFQYQAEENVAYKTYLTHLRIATEAVQSLRDIPFLPISFFKTHEVVSGNRPAEIIFSSSGTTGMQQSRHIVSDLSVYRQSFMQGFELFYGKPSDWVILALLPSYLEREGSSLILMAEELITATGDARSAFYLHNHDELHKTLLQLEAEGKQTLLLGVSFALLDFADAYPMVLKHTVVMETGGMKGRRKEMIREELHEELRKGFGLDKIHSEYGMTELLGQAYSPGKGIFHCPPWMGIQTREPNDPLSHHTGTRPGGINIIDLSNLNSCAFIATQDLGKVYDDGSFEVLGRFDNSDIRGCNLLIDS